MSHKTELPNCIYCDMKCLNVKKGDHIISEALGGFRTIKNVCKSCNTGVLSGIDSELSVLSPLSTLAIRELGKAGGFYWDVAHVDGNLLVEANPHFESKELDAFQLWPQLILKGESLSIMTDLTEMKAIGERVTQLAVLKQAKYCYQRRKNGKHKKDKEWLKFEHVPERFLPQHHRYPPRIFASERLADFTPKTTMTVRYSTLEDRRRIMLALERLDPEMRFKNTKSSIGSHTPHYTREWDPEVQVRALMKIGVNALKDTCTKTEVNRHTFPDATDIVMRRRRLKKEIYFQFGFMNPELVSSLSRKNDNGHTIRLMHTSIVVPQLWTVIMTFFGGAMAAFVRFPGPNYEDWVTADISMPLRTAKGDLNKQWKVEKTALSLATRKLKSEWVNPRVICPSVKVSGMNRFIEYPERKRS